jgi:Icc-related predicted phosphoesterase
MNIQIFSDLHVDVSRPPPITIRTDVDVVVVAGDTAEGAGNAFVALRHIVPERIPIVMVMGNHEYYHHCIPDELALARELAPSLNVHLLENNSVVLEISGVRVRFVGCTLWTDYRLFGANNAATAMRMARYGMNDHRLISWHKNPWRRFRPEEALLTHTASKAYLVETLATPFAGPTVVVTHHAPQWLSVHPQYRGDLLTAAFVSDLSALIMEFQPVLWVHGHVHSSFDYAVGRSRVLCNPHGYWQENPKFIPSLVVKVGS